MVPVAAGFGAADGSVGGTVAMGRVVGGAVVVVVAACASGTKAARAAEVAATSRTSCRRMNFLPIELERPF
jgi:hypothetical protein